MDQVDHILAQWHSARPDLDVGPMGTLGRLKRLVDHLSAELAALYKSYNLTPASFDVLATLRRSGAPYALSPSSLIDWTMVTSGTMTNRLDRLQAAGLIERRANPQDGRGSVVALTPQGFALIETVIAAHVDTQHRLIAGLPEAMRASFDAQLKTWLSAFEQDRAPHHSPAPDCPRPSE